MKKLIELNERLSGIYAELYSIKKDMETFYEDEITHNEKVVRLDLIAREITEIQQNIENEIK
jgi:hypothetical protein